MPKKIYIVTHYDGDYKMIFTSFTQALSFAIRRHGLLFSYSLDSSVDIFLFKQDKVNKKTIKGVK